jgi:hypothetical protein
MKRELFKWFILSFILSLVSCNGPQTSVTNYVHPDGSVTRMIEMRSTQNKVESRFKLSDLQVPFDSTWKIRDSIEIGNKGDTTWVRRAEKLFKSAEEINLTYKCDSGANKAFSRYTIFKKSFKWFNTEFRFTEKIDKNLSFGYPVQDFLNKEELRYFYSPESLKHKDETGPDSVKYKALGDSVQHKTDIWTGRNLVSEWIGEFARLTEGKADSGMSVQALKAHEIRLSELIEKNDKVLDSLWKNGIILRELIGRSNALRYRSEADSALSLVSNKFLSNFSGYSVKTVMPGKVIGTNGFIDSSSVIFWPVKADYFLTEPYEMWAESKITNSWAWIISGLFVVFVLSGVVMRLTKRGRFKA